MSRYVKLASSLFLFVLIGLSQNLVNAEENGFSAKIYTHNEGRYTVHYFENDNELSFKAFWNRSEFKLDFDEIVSIRFINGPTKYGSVYKRKAEVIFKNGDKLKFFVRPEKWLTGYTKHGKKMGRFSLRSSEVIFIEFFDGNLGSTEIGSSKTIDSLKIYDQIILKNGDRLIGTIKDTSFTLNASYGVLDFETKKINNIHFENGKRNIDIVTLRAGDKLSGVLENNSINFLLNSGADITVGKDKIKSVIFRR
jgi:hypothetical protein